MKKRILLGAVLTVCIITSSTIVLANRSASAPDWMQKADQSIEDQIAKKNSNTPSQMKTNSFEGQHGPYEKYLLKAASEQQKELLNHLKEDESLGFGEWIRKSLMIIGELSNDQKRLTLDEAKQIISQHSDEETIKNTFNAIAGAPDWVGGSGIRRTVYFLDEKQTTAIYLMNGDVLLVITDDSGNQQIESLKHSIAQKSDHPLQPQPTVPPQDTN